MVGVNALSSSQCLDPVGWVTWKASILLVKAWFGYP